MAMLPCKPDKGVRSVALAGQEVSMRVMGCEAGGATFAILHAQLPDPSQSDRALAQWKAASLAGMKNPDALARPFTPAGALGLPASVLVSASGLDQGGNALQTQAAYFAHGRQVFQAIILAAQIKSDAAETFFSGLRFE